APARSRGARRPADLIGAGRDGAEHGEGAARGRPAVAGRGRIMRSGSVPFHRYVMFWAIALGGAAFDLGTKAAIFASIAEPPAPARPLVANVLELRTSYNP